MRFVTPVLLLLGCQLGTARAENICRTDVTYQWKREKEETAASVPFSRLEARGKDEAAAKANLQELVAREKGRALEQCRLVHENGAGCVARKFELYGVSMHTLGFSGRKKLEEAIAKDCAASQGLCVEGAAAEPACVVVEEVKAEAPAKDKKEGKGKKK